MNKLLKLTLAALMAISLGACGSKNEHTDKDSKGTGNNSDAIVDSNQSNLNTNNDVSSSFDKETIKIPMEKIYIDYESKLRRVDSSYCELVYDTNDGLVGFCYDLHSDELVELDNVVEYFSEYFIDAAYYSSRGNLSGELYKVISSERTNIADFESVKFYATVNNDKAWDCHIYGYAFVIDDVPFAVIGLVSEKTQSPELIEKIEARVDYKVSTLRTTE